MSTPRSRLAVVGENVMDLLPTRHGADVLRAVPGGGPANTAVAAARLGVPTRFLARIGNDAFGGIIRERLLSEGLDPRGLFDAEEPSALALATLGPDLRRENCAERLAGGVPATSGDDEIAQRHRALQQALAQRCQELRLQAAAAAGAPLAQ